MPSINFYVNALAGLHVHRAGRRPAPHKPLLLLSVMELVEEGYIEEGMVCPDERLAERFERLWRCYAGATQGFKGSMVYPFFHMDYEPFWQLCPTPECRHLREYSSLTSLRRDFAFARLAPELFALMQNPEARNVFRRVLVQTYLSS